MTGPQIQRIAATILKSSHRQPPSDPPGWGLRARLITPHCKIQNNTKQLTMSL